jgi:inner membrane protein YidH
MAVVDPPDTRFTQANERTFLAWNRTALAFIASGLAVEQFLDTGRAARLVVAIPLILLGGCVGVAGYFRWKHAEDAIRSGQDLAPSRMPKVLAIAFGAFTVGAIILVIASTR